VTENTVHPPPRAAALYAAIAGDVLRIWFLGYRDPVRFGRAAIRAPAPWAGLAAVAIRSALDVGLVYLPAAMSGRQPPMESFIPGLPTETYYGSLLWLTPLVFLAQWLVTASVLCLVLRTTGHACPLAPVLNLVGLSSLVIGAILVPWDWLTYALGGLDQVTLGISHLVIDLWWFVLVMRIREFTGASRRTALVASVAGFVATLPLAVIFMRAPY
jgi:hypothetical protein